MNESSAVRRLATAVSPMPDGSPSGVSHSPRGRRHVIAAGRAVRSLVFAAAAIILALGAIAPAAHAVAFTPASTADLIGAISSANGNGEDDIIDLGGGTFTLTVVDHVGSFGGSNGLPDVGPDGGHKLIIRNGTIQRDSTAPAFRIIEVKSAATLELEEVTLTGGNVPSGAGGAVLNFGTLTLTNSTVSGNSAGPGGGIYSQGGAQAATLTLTNSTVSSNSSGSGGGIYNESSTLTLTNSTVSGNSAGAGGGIFNRSATATITNSTISGNDGFQGGGIFTSSRTSWVTLINSTLSGNDGGDGGAIHGAAGRVTFRATVLDTGSVGPNCDGQSLITFESLGSNVADDGTCFPNAGTDRVVANGALRLGPLQDNGGPTETHALLADSPAIDFVQGGCDVEADQRGTARPQDGDGNDTKVCDSGAFERLASSGSASAAANSPSNDDKEDEKKDDNKNKETEEQRQQRERTNRSNKSEYATEGNVLAVEPLPDGKHLLVTIGLTKNEKLVVQVTCIELQCPDIRVGDYLEADGYQNGVGDPNTYFIAEEVTVVRGNKRIR